MRHAPPSVIDCATRSHSHSYALPASSDLQSEGTHTSSHPGLPQPPDHSEHTMAHASQPALSSVCLIRRIHGEKCHHGPISDSPTPRDLQAHVHPV